MIELTAMFHNERFRFEGRNGNPDTIIGDVTLDKPVEGYDGPNTLAVKGPADHDELKPFISYRFYGRFTEYRNKRTGRSEQQFTFKTFVESQPVSRAGVINYLKSMGAGRGIGSARATKLWDLFGTNAVKVARESPDVISAAIKGLSIEKAEELAEELRERQELEETTMGLMSTLDGRGFPKTLPKRLIKEWGTKAPEIVKRDPHRLMIFPRCGFLTCDKLYLELGHDPMKLRRQALACWYAIASNTEGHTWFPIQQVCNRMTQYLGPGVDHKRAVKLALKIGKWNMDRPGAVEIARADKTHLASDGDQIFLAEGRKAWQETRIARLIDDAAQEPHLWPKPDEVPDITEHQRDALRLALRGPIAILGGSPGTGKTWTAARLIRILAEHHGLHRVGIAAPTGKAAVRISEVMNNYGIPIRARTWHSLLGVGGQSENGTWSFNHNEDNQWDASVIVGDESSMLDTSLFCAIMRARARGTQILLVGDVNQLPPVGHGAPLRDLINAGLPYGELREIKRNSGGIVEACASIRDGKPWKADDNLIVEDTVVDPMHDIMRKINYFKKKGWDPVWDCQVVVPVNLKSKISRKAVNDYLANELNPNPREPGVPFSVGDKVVNTKNGFFDRIDNEVDPDIQLNKQGQVMVANGELAKVLEVGEKHVIAELSSPKRTVKFFFGFMNKKEKKAAEEKGESSTGSSWDLGYALSVHKSQGSEWPIVIVMIDEYPGARMVCSREWVYTAISRAKETCVMLGKKAVADDFCKRQALNIRKTFLRERIILNQTERVLVDL